MTVLDRQDLSWCLRRSPRAVLMVLKKWPGQVFVGGGFVRSCVGNEKVSDIDLFVPHAKMAREVAVFIQSKVEGKLHETDNALTVHGGSLPFSVQVIHRWVYATSDELMQSFDFTVAMAGFWWDAANPAQD